jgi:hypothetical protein
LSRIGRAIRVAALSVGAVGATGLAVLARSTEWFASLGARATGERLERMRRSPQWSAGAQRFVNAMPTHTMLPRDAARSLRLQVAGGETRYPVRPIPVEARRRSDFERPPASGLRATWLGHATALVEVDGARILTDPVWSERVSPSTLVGPRRFFEPPIALADLPRVDAVVISHDHYDHLDMETVKTLARTGARFCAASARTSRGGGCRRRRSTNGTGARRGRSPASRSPRPRRATSRGGGCPTATRRSGARGSSRAFGTASSTAETPATSTGTATSAATTDRST